MILDTLHCMLQRVIIPFHNLPSCYSRLRFKCFIAWGLATEFIYVFLTSPHVCHIPTFLTISQSITIIISGEGHKSLSPPILWRGTAVDRVRDSAIFKIDECLPHKMDCFVPALDHISSWSTICRHISDTLILYFTLMVLISLHE